MRRERATPASSLFIPNAGAPVAHPHAPPWPRRTRTTAKQAVSGPDRAAGREPDRGIHLVEGAIDRNVSSSQGMGVRAAANEREDEAEEGEGEGAVKPGSAATGRGDGEGDADDATRPAGASAPDAAARPGRRAARFAPASCLM
ncbi:hypothetical protein C5746_18055 [Streptomyces atratus]|uniref:Uncharacterized protein n=1 Tax=Streptomyces atratus TaxID=1893 RepID=A0A2Z5JDR4_STRAR|nr:hypothetical protein C5746_18055 [Streptomyces atratus]